MWNKRVDHFGPFAAFEAAALFLLFATAAIAGDNDDFAHSQGFRDNSGSRGTNESGNSFWRRFVTQKSLVKPKNVKAIIRNSNKWFLNEKKLPDTGYLKRTSPVMEGLQLYVDFDDTLTSGMFLPNDKLYPKGVPYPGATQLLYEISKRRGASAFRPRLITARSDVEKDQSVLEAFKEAGNRNGERQGWEIDIDNSLFMTFPRKLLRRGRTKASFVEERLKDDGEVILFGDNGDDDEAAAVRLVGRDQVKAFFIHTVVVKPPKVNAKIVYFRSYIDAASKAAMRDFISYAAFRNVVVQAYQDVIQIMVEPTGGHRRLVLVFHHLLPDFLSALKTILRNAASDARRDESLQFVLREVLSFANAVDVDIKELNTLALQLGTNGVGVPENQSDSSFDITQFMNDDYA